MNTQKAKWLKKLCTELRISNYRKVKKMYMTSSPKKKENFESFLREVMRVKTFISGQGGQANSSVGTPQSIHESGRNTPASTRSKHLENSINSKVEVIEGRI